MPAVEKEALIWSGPEHAIRSVLAHKVAPLAVENSCCRVYIIYRAFQASLLGGLRIVGCRRLQTTGKPYDFLGPVLRQFLAIVIEA